MRRNVFITRLFVYLVSNYPNLGKRARAPYLRNYLENYSRRKCFGET